MLGSGKAQGLARASRYREAGFTLVELMVTVAVLAIVAAIAAPSMTNMVNGSRLTSQANELVSAMQMARSEAIRLNRTVQVCATTDGTTCATPATWQRWIVRTTTADNANVVLQAGEVRNSLTVRSSGFPLSFRGNGMARKQDGSMASGAQISVCVPVAGMSFNQRAVNFSGAGRISVDKVSGGGVCAQ